ncbi:hypothetical protein [Amycolatopsis sp. YIM 10]|uniref:hypothetical protein n=1 Tax=Amycolatopsis sp. YIM 10 TaxID=2653857 RepID=UPI00128FEFF1|nr:hypothetical protein [Amycolatopsis sp. YIM 10]QFU85413.1 hypothetical protein YIM_00900 [Amycolatopsis sp. YIM 10]
MSPVSRGRKKKSTGGKRKPQGGPAADNSLYRAILAEFAEIAPDEDLLDIELRASEMAAPPDDHRRKKTTAEQLLELIDYARRHPGPGAVNLLAGLRWFATYGDTADAAARALVEVLETGRQPPRWAVEIGRAEPGECWLCRDPFGEQDIVLCSFGRAGEGDHGVLALIGLGGVVDELEVIDDPAGVLAELRENLDEDDSLERISGVEARRLLTDALIRTDPMMPEHLAVEGLVINRLRLLGNIPDEPPREVEVDVDAAVERFFTANPGVENTAEHRELVEWLAVFAQQQEPRWELHVGPELLLMVADELPEELSPELLEAWIRWRAAERGLSENALDELLEMADGLYENGDPYLDGIGEDDDVEAVLERRRFALPEAHTTIGDEEVDLDPADLDDRVLLVLGEHPELHEAVAAESLDTRSAELLGTKAMVVHQLWDNEPPEVWAAARTLRDSGLDRSAVLDRLRGVLLENAHESEDGIALDIENYQRALTALG